MALFEDIRLKNDIDGIIADNQNEMTQSPSSIATKIYAAYTKGEYFEHEHIAIEYYKRIAKERLASKFNPKPEDGQQDLFSGRLQDYYPTPRESGEEPVYKILRALSHDDVQYNVNLLRKTGQSFIDHAIALEAYWISRSTQSSA